jgi:hypothetical protein
MTPVLENGGAIRPWHRLTAEGKQITLDPNLWADIVTVSCGTRVLTGARSCNGGTYPLVPGRCSNATDSLRRS